MKSGRLIYALAQLSERARGLLALLAIVIVPVAVVFLVVLPMLQSRDAAQNSAFESQAMLNWISEQVRKLPAEGAEVTPTNTLNTDPIGISGIEESLVRIDLRPHVSQLANRTSGGVDLALEEAPFEGLSTWLPAVTPVWGYEIAAFRIEAASPGLVNATFELESMQ